MQWGALEDDNIGRWIVHWKNAGWIVGINELDNLVEGIYKVRKEVDQVDDTIGCNGI